MEQKYDVTLTNVFRRDYKNISKRGYNLVLLKEFDANGFSLGFVLKI